MNYLTIEDKIEHCKKFVEKKLRWKDLMEMNFGLN